MNLADFVANAERAVVFTGAGISTESGIPDFRSPGGVWTRLKPIQFDDFLNDEDVRREAWRRLFEGEYFPVAPKPNAGHRAVAALVAHGKADCVITQNIDNLHQDSGVPGEKVIEVHGNATYAKCLECGTRIELDVIREQYQRLGLAEPCVCGGLVKNRDHHLRPADARSRNGTGTGSGARLRPHAGDRLLAFRPPRRPFAARSAKKRRQARDPQ